MVYVVLFTAVLLFFAAILRPKMKWPKWLAYVWLAFGIFIGGSELFYPDPVLDVRSMQAGFMAAVIGGFWAFPAICYAIGRFLRWAFTSQRSRTRQLS